jgi:DNA-binding IclR family transcriptional regulator
LRLLARHDEPLGVNSIAKELGLVPSTCLHILRALAAESFVYVDPASKLYSLDAGLLPLAQKIMRQDDFGQRVAPYLESFAEPNVAFRLYVEIGSHFPALISATGRCCAAFGQHDPAAVKVAFSELQWDRPPNLKDWLAEVEEARKSGFSVDAGQYLRGITVVAAPVFDRNGLMSHALTTVGLSERLDMTKIGKLGEALRQAGLTLSHGQPTSK